MYPDEWFVGIVAAVCGVIGVGLLGLLGCAIYDNATADKFSLRKDSWECSKSHVETIIVNQIVGKVIVPNIILDTVCDQWTAK